MKILNIFATIIFINIFCISNEPINADSRFYFSEKNDFQLIGWKIKKNSNSEKRQILLSFKKLKKIRRLKPYFREAVGYVFPNVESELGLEELEAMGKSLQIIKLLVLLL